MSLSYRNQSIDLQSKSVDWFLYKRDIRFFAEIAKDYSVSTYVKFSGKLIFLAS